MGAIVVAFAAGFLLRGAQLRKQKSRVCELEKEMMTSHSEILDLHKEKLALEKQLKGASNIPVIPITAKEEKKSDKSTGSK
ncbi:hypothetical protein [Niastella yeongjuensis]|uniref:hypothetical protein n=1 Tax=Niastella yeongjuensis TaxID=354355 RepID=UPI001054E9D0|nr:hypothetical protein [Niastella yeongjuensis]